MIPQFAIDVLVNFVGGAGAGLLILCLAERVFGIRKEAQRRQEERKAGPLRVPETAEGRVGGTPGHHSCRGKSRGLLFLRIEPTASGAV